MSCVLRLIGLVFLLSCLVHQLVKTGPPPSIEATLNPNGESLLVWTPSAQGQYFLYLRYNAESVPEDVRKNFLNWKLPLQTNWEAALSISTNRVLCVSKKSLNLEPAVESGHGLYFLIGQCELKEPERVEISLTPRQPPPFAGAVPSLSLRPSELSYESYHMRGLFWRALNLACIPVAVALLIDYLLLRKRRLKTAQSA